MRIAISGAHGTGKSTLAEVLVEALPGYTNVEEPYYQLLDDGYDFEEEPSLDDFALQLQRSIASLAEERTNVIFDRCPADFLAYIFALGGTDPGSLMTEAKRAMETLDLIVLVPIETPDRISLPDQENPRLRRQVDQRLHELLIDNDIEVQVEVIAVAGSVGERVERIFQRIR